MPTRPLSKAKYQVRASEERGRRTGHCSERREPLRNGDEGSAACDQRNYAGPTSESVEPGAPPRVVSDADRYRKLKLCKLCLVRYLEGGGRDGGGTRGDTVPGFGVFRGMGVCTGGAGGLVGGVGGFAIH